MRKKQRDPLEAGRIIKQIAPVLGITIDELMERTSKKVHRGIETVRQYFYEGQPWPFEDMGYDDCLEIVCNFLSEQQREGKLTEQDVKEKREDAERILKVAFVDLDTLSFHGRKSWDTEKKKIVNDSYNNPMACLREPPIPYVHKDISGDTITDTIEMQVEWIMQDISNLDIETLYVLNRYFDAFSSVTERDLKWIDYLDCLGHNKVKRELSKKEFPVNSKLISENMNSKDFLQWLELLSRRGYRDTTRKTDSDRLKSAVEEKVRSYADKCGLKIIFFHNFIQCLVNKHNGSFFDVEPKYWKTFVLIKYWVSHFEDVPEMVINTYPPQIEEERQP